jgi:hypothetical protein
MLGEGRASSGRKWAITAAIVILLLAVMYGITARRTDSSDQQRQNNAQNAPASSTTVPGQALPGGRTTADAPPTAKPSTVTPAPSK